MRLTEKNKLILLTILGALIVSALLYRTLISQENEQTGPAAELTLDTMILENDEQNVESDSKESEEEELHNQEIHVDIKGAVERPGVYTMVSDQRVIDVIEKAGGLLEHSDASTINFAKQLEDEMMIYVPLIGEEVVAEASAGHEAAEGISININQADLNDLLNLNGIGPQKAQEIITYRESNGDFNTVEDITKVSGIGEKTFEKIQQQITVK